MKTYMLENVHVIVPISMDVPTITLPGFQESGISMRNLEMIIFLSFFFFTLFRSLAI